MAKYNMYSYEELAKGAIYGGYREQLLFYKWAQIFMPSNFDSKGLKFWYENWEHRLNAVYDADVFDDLPVIVDFALYI